jgi:hypothetical protein
MTGKTGTLKLAMPDQLKDFQSTLTEAVADLADHGYDSMERVARWTRALREAAERSMIAPSSLEDQLRKFLASTYTRFVDGGGIYKRHPGIARYTLERIKPHLRSELDRRIMASANLIKLNRAESIEKTLRRFQGWATAIPVGGVPNPKKGEAKADIRKALGSLSFEERRVIIDQSAKLISAINDIVAKDGGAIAGKWNSNWRRPGYNYREDHKERDQEYFLIRDSWAHLKGLVKKNKNGYADEVDQPGEKIFCSCWFTFIYSLRDLPSDMLTVKGKNALAGAREQIAAGLADSEPTIPAGLDSEGKPHIQAPNQGKPTGGDLQAIDGITDALWGGPKKIALGNIKSQQSWLNPPRVEHYRGMIQRGEKISPIVLGQTNYASGPKYKIIEGHHRFAAHKAEGKTHILANTKLFHGVKFNDADLEPMPTRSTIPIPVDRDHDVPAMFVIAANASRLYADRSIPRELTLEGVTFDPARLGFAHEWAELKKMVALTRAFIAEYNRLPNEQERIAISKCAHYEAGVPAERAEAEKLGVPWKAWSDWSAGKLSALEHRRVRNPPPNAHVIAAPHWRSWPMENIVNAA